MRGEEEEVGAGCWVHGMMETEGERKDLVVIERVWMMKGRKEEIDALFRCAGVRGGCHEKSVESKRPSQGTRAGMMAKE
jgi:hypothetical protein